MLRSTSSRRWLTLVMAVCCALQGTLLGTAHHVWCCHASHAYAPDHAAAHAACGGAESCSGVTFPAWSGHHHSHDPRPDSPHDWRNCLACRYMAERPLPSLAPQLTESLALLERPADATSAVASIGALSSYHSRAPPL